jgi:hypothetical protein
VKIVCDNAQVNDASFQSITREEAVAMLKSISVRVRLVIGKPGYHAADTDSLFHVKNGFNYSYIQMFILYILGCTVYQTF